MTATLEGGERSAARPGRTLPLGKTRLPILQKAGWAPGPVWTGGHSVLQSSEATVRTSILAFFRVPFGFESIKKYLWPSVCTDLTGQTQGKADSNGDLNVQSFLCGRTVQTAGC